MRKVLLSTLLSALPLLCQTAQLSGLIKDSSDAGVPNAKLTVTNQETGLNRVTESNGVGIYTVPLLQPGVYRVLVQAAGFQGMNREGIKLDVDQDARLDFTLQIGKSETMLDVYADA